MGTLVWLDDFESYTAGVAIPAPWASVTNTLVSTASAHAGTKSVPIGASGNTSDATRPLGSNIGPSWYADFWFNSNASSSTGTFIRFADAGGTDAGVTFFPAGVSSGTGSLGVHGATNNITFAVINGTWQHALIEVTQAAAGTMKLTLDGTVIGTYSGDTRGSTSNQTFIAEVHLHGQTIGPAPPAEVFVDDLGVYSGVVGGVVQARAVVMA